MPTTPPAAPPTPLHKLRKTLHKEWFLVGMLGAVILATLLPDLGRSGGVLHGDVLADIGIAIVFFLHGLGISFASMRQGLLRWPVHVVVQLTTFVVFPLLWWLLEPLVAGHIPTGLALGFCYLCALPSTISSSVAMTGLARGNVPAAIFNATLSSVIGIVLTPLIVALFVHGAGTGAMNFADAVFSIARLLLLPLVVGQLLRPVLHAWHHKYKRYTNLLDRWVILLLVYTAFCDSVASGLWRDNGAGTLLIAMLGAGLPLAIVLVLSTWTARRLGFNTEDEITTVFCGSKKTLASGVPMAKLLFGAHPALGLIVLPIMFYHQIQLFVCAMLANRYARRPEIT
ncbi:bile acid:sodium symporter family protein [Zoogloea sp.]|uniref:bile acid:sodium symporter family protein n=1 Tax=Zoogloea sp. TaxID=49181 RepID=UPI0035B3BD8C